MQPTVDAIHAISLFNASINNSTVFARIVPIIGAMLHHSGTAASRGHSNPLRDDCDVLGMTIATYHDNGGLLDAEFATLTELLAALRETIKVVPAPDAVVLPSARPVAASPKPKR